MSAVTPFIPTRLRVFSSEILVSCNNGILYCTRALWTPAFVYNTYDAMSTSVFYVRLVHRVAVAFNSKRRYPAST